MTRAEPHFELVEAWLEHLIGQGRSAHTRNAYQRAWQHLAGWYQDAYEEACDPANLIARDLRDWKSHQQSAEKAAPSTINQRLVAVSSLL